MIKKIFTLSLILIGLHFIENARALVFSFKPNIILESARSYRGAVYWDKPTLTVVDITLFNIITLGSNELSAQWMPNNNWKIKAGLFLFGDGKPGFPTYNISTRRENNTNLRNRTTDAFGHFQYQIPKKYILTFEIYKEIRKHKGSYLFLKGGYYFKPFFRTDVGMGYGSKKMNQYIFGPEGQTGPTHFEVSPTLIIPIPKIGDWVTKITKLHIIKTKNREALFVKEGQPAFIFSTAVSWKFGK